MYQSPLLQIHILVHLSSEIEGGAASSLGIVTVTGSEIRQVEKKSQLAG
jgi:hypothetical protein